MAMVRPAGARIRHEVKGGRVYELLVPSRAMRLEFDRDVRDQCALLARELGVPDIRWHDRQELDVLLDWALGELADGEDLEVLQGRVEAWRELREAEGATETIEAARLAYLEIEQLAYDHVPGFQNAVRDNERRNEIAGDCLLRRFVVGLEGAKPFDRPYGRLSDSDYERIEADDRAELMVAAYDLLRPNEAEEKKSA